MARWTLVTFPIATAAVLGLTWPLPLRSWTIAATAAAIVALTFETLRQARREWQAQRQTAALAAAAAAALSIVAAIALGYAAFALVRVGVFGPVTRLGYPFLVASGLRLDGGAWLALLCAIVSIVPLAFSDK